VQRKNENKIINSNYYEKNYHLGRHCIGGIKDVWGLKNGREINATTGEALKKICLIFAREKQREKSQTKKL